MYKCKKKLCFSVLCNITSLHSNQKYVHMTQGRLTKQLFISSKIFDRNNRFTNMSNHNRIIRFNGWFSCVHSVDNEILWMLYLKFFLLFFLCFQETNCLLLKNLLGTRIQLKPVLSKNCRVAFTKVSMLQYIIISIYMSSHEGDDTFKVLGENQIN